MCQLTLANTNNMELNRLFSLMLPRINSETINKDGFGFFTEGSGITKTIYAASDLNNGGEVIRNAITSDKPVMLHARAASKGIAVAVENVHPFESEDFVLAHNGTLYLLNEKVEYWPKDENRASDSLMFLKSLQNHFKGDVVVALQEAMKLYKGKFAFLIYHKSSKQYYAVRGKTADLHIASISLSKEGEVFGYVINTLKPSLTKSLLEVSNVWQMGGKERLPLFYKVEELPVESIFLCGKVGVEKVGEIQETASYTTNFTKGGEKAFQQAFPVITKKVTDKKDSSFEENVRFIREVVYDNKMSFTDLCVVVNGTLGVPLHAISEEDLEMLSKKIFPKLMPQAKVRKHLAKYFLGRYIKADFFKTYNLQFPIGANRHVTSSTLIRFLTLYLKKA